MARRGSWASPISTWSSSSCCGTTSARSRTCRTSSRASRRVRRSKTVDTTQQTDFSSTESTEEKEQDLSSTSRFELQSASQSVISQTASKDAGVTIHASYGPSVDATAHYNGTSSTSNQQSRSASASYAKEITSKAVERVVTRSVTSRTVTTTRQVEDLNARGWREAAHGPTAAIARLEGRRCRDRHPKVGEGLLRRQADAGTQVQARPQAGQRQRHCHRLIGSGR